MQRGLLILVVSVCLGVVGCAPSASQRLVGKWQCDMLEGAEEESGMQEAILGMAQAAGLKMEMQIEFKADHTVGMSVPLFDVPSPEGVRWDVTKEEGETMTVEISQPESEAIEVLKITFLDDDRFRLTPPGTEGKPLLFSRVKEE